MQRVVGWCVIVTACAPVSRVVVDHEGAGGENGSIPAETAGSGNSTGSSGSGEGAKAGWAGRPIIEAGVGGYAVAPRAGGPGAGGSLSHTGEGGESGGDERSIPWEGGAPGLGHSCDEKPRDSCVMSCLSFDRYEAVRGASGKLRCPEHAPIAAEDCEINCEEVYGTPAFEKDYCWLCGAGTTCIAYDDSLTDETVRCSPVPTDCSQVAYNPLCGPDGNLYDNHCEAQRARIAGSSGEECGPVEGYYPCGHLGRYCQEGLEYCYAAVSYDSYADVYYSCTESPCVEDGGCDCLGFGEGGAGGNGADEYPETTCLEELPGRVFVTEHR